GGRGGRAICGTNAAGVRCDRVPPMVITWPSRTRHAASSSERRLSAELHVQTNSRLERWSPVEACPGNELLDGRGAQSGNGWTRGLGGGGLPTDCGLTGGENGREQDKSDDRERERLY